MFDWYGGIMALEVKLFRPSLEGYSYYIAKLAIFPDMTIEYDRKYKENAPDRSLYIKSKIAIS